MCKAMTEIREEGRIEGVKEGKIKGLKEGEKTERISNIRSLMETLNLTAKQAMDALKIPVSEQEEYQKLL